MNGSRAQRHDTSAPPVTAADLYDRSGRPHGSDIAQGELGDCYLISTLGQYADRQPGVIRDAIRYDARDQSFGVTLHDAAGRTRTITVTQDDLRADRAYGVDHTGGVSSPARWAGTHADGSRPPAWPGVMEVAYAKLNAASPRDATGTDLGGIAGGGWPRNAIHALTGQSDTREVWASQLRDQDKAYDLLKGSIRDGRAVLLATNPMKDTPNDGLVKGNYLGDGNPLNSGHAYTVERVSKDKDGNVSLTLRNPWGDNSFPKQGVNSLDPIVHVRLKTILDNGHLENVTIGPGLVQRRTASDAAHPGEAAKQNAAPGTSTVDDVPRFASGQAVAGDSLRDRWSQVAARARQDTAVGAPVTDAAVQPVSDQPVASDPHRRYWSDLAAKGLELMKTSQGATQTDVVSPARRLGRTP